MIPFTALNSVDERWVDLPATVEAAATARAFVRETLTEWQHLRLEPEATLAVSELVTNAVVHAHSGSRVTLINQGGAIQLRVADDAAEAPHFDPMRDDREGGRGMHLIAAVCQRWGVEAQPVGKIVWLDITDP